MSLIGVISLARVLVLRPRSQATLFRREGLLRFRPRAIQSAQRCLERSARPRFGRHRDVPRRQSTLSKWLALAACLLCDKSEPSHSFPAAGGFRQSIHLHASQFACSLSKSPDKEPSERHARRSARVPHQKRAAREENPPPAK